jgi:hypothetical protein
MTRRRITWLAGGALGLLLLAALLRGDGELRYTTEAASSCASMRASRSR